jgi:hypothetical protein
VAATPEVRDVIVRIGTIPVDSPPPTELQKILASEIDRWGSLIQRAGLAKTEWPGAASVIPSNGRRTSTMNDAALLREKAATLTQMPNFRTIGMFGHVSVRGPAPASSTISVNPVGAGSAPRCRRRAGRVGADTDTGQFCRPVESSYGIEACQGHRQYSDCQDRAEDGICLEPAIEFGRIPRIVRPDSVFHDTTLPAREPGKTSFL